MKKLLITLFVFAVAGMMITGCGDQEEERMSESEIKAQVDSLFDIESSKLTETLTLECVERKESELQGEVDRLVNAATDVTAPIEDELPADEGEMDDEMEMEDEEMDEEAEDTRTDEQIIQDRLDERLANLRTELEEECTEQILAQAKLKADSILISRDLEARYNTPQPSQDNKSGTGSEETQSDKRKKMSGEDAEDTRQDKRDKMNRTEEDTPQDKRDKMNRKK